MRRHLDRFVGRVKGDPFVEPKGMPPTAIHGTSSQPAKSPNPPAKHATPPATRATRSRKSAVGGAEVWGELTDEEIDARVRIATNQLRRLGAFEDTSAVPLGHLSDEQLDRRIRQVEVELEKLKKEAVGPDGHSGPAKVSRAESMAVLRELEVLECLIDNPDATISPAAAMDAIADEPRRWADLAFGRPSEPQPAGGLGPRDHRN